MTNESKIIELVNKLAPCNRDDVLLGIGDDTALVRTGDQLLLTSDLLVEGTHFDFLYHDPYDVGRKCLAVNISDIAAMGGHPSYALLSLAIRHGLDESSLRRFIEGFCDLARIYGISLVGGDTNVTKGPFVASVALSGSTHRRGVVTRAGAKVGNLLAVSGPLGGSYESGKHLNFVPRVSEAKALLDRISINAMMDLSDGLGADLPKLCTKSGVGAVIWADAIPLNTPISLLRPPSEQIRRALGDGEDFELLIAIEPSDALLAKVIVPSLTFIGEVTERKKRGTEQTFGEAAYLSLVTNGKERPWPKLGYEHRW